MAGDGGRFRVVARHTWPILAALASAVVKVSLFNLPPASRNSADWFAWSATEAVGAVVSSLAILSLVFAPLLFLRPRSGGVAAWLLNGIGSLFVLADLLHVRYFSDIAPLTAASVAWQAPFIWESVLALVRRSDALLLLDVTIALATYWWTRKRTVAVEGSARGRRRLGGALLVAGAVGMLVPLWIVTHDVNEVFRWEYFRFFCVRMIGLPTYRAYEVVRAIKRSVSEEVADGAEQVERAATFLDERTPTGPPTDSLFGIARGANLILVMVESLHAWPVPLVIEGQAVMPNLDAFSKQSIRFDRFYGQTWYGKTTDAEFIALNALHPLVDGSIQARYPTNGFHALPEVLAARGYDTFSAHAFYAAMYRRAEMHPRWGFARSYFGEDYPTKDVVGMGVGDGEFFAQTIPHMSSAGKPFMALLITLSSHYPFRLAPRHRSLRLGGLDSTMLGGYLQAVHYTDAALGRLFAELQRTGLLETSVVALFGDHREQALTPTALAPFLDRQGVVEQKPGFDLALWKEENRLPFLVRLPGGGAAGSRTGSGGQVDIAPTLLSVLGIDPRGLVSLGRNLLDASDGLVVMRDASFVIGDTACVAPGGSVTRRTCGVMSTGALLDTSRFVPQLIEARARLSTSDAILRGNLIPALAARRNPGTPAPR